MAPDRRRSQIDRTKVLYLSHSQHFRIHLLQINGSVVLVSYVGRSDGGYLVVRGVSADGCNLRQRVGRYRLSHQPLPNVIASLRSCSSVGEHSDSMSALSTSNRYFDYCTLVANCAAIGSSRTEHGQLEVSEPFQNSYQQLML